MFALDGPSDATTVTTAAPDSRLELFVRGNDGALWHIWQEAPGGSWLTWSSHGGAGGGFASARRWPSTPMAGWSSSCGARTAPSGTSGRRRRAARGRPGPPTAASVVASPAPRRWPSTATAGWSSSCGARTAPSGTSGRRGGAARGRRTGPPTAASVVASPAPGAGPQRRWPAGALRAGQGRRPLAHRQEAPGGSWLTWSSHGGAGGGFASARCWPSTATAGWSSSCGATTAPSGTSGRSSGAARGRPGPPTAAPAVASPAPGAGSQRRRPAGALRAGQRRRPRAHLADGAERLVVEGLVVPRQRRRWLRQRPALALNGDGRLELFVRGNDGALWHKWQEQRGGAWSTWSSRGSAGGGFAGSPPDRVSPPRRARRPPRPPGWAVRPPCPGRATAATARRSPTRSSGAARSRCTSAKRCWIGATP